MASLPQFIFFTCSFSSHTLDLSDIKMITEFCQHFYINTSIFSRNQNDLATGHKGREVHDEPLHEKQIGWLEKWSRFIFQTVAVTNRLCKSVDNSLIDICKTQCMSIAAIFIARVKDHLRTCCEVNRHSLQSVCGRKEISLSWRVIWQCWKIKKSDWGRCITVMAPVSAAGLHFILFLGSVRENRNADRVKNYLLQTLAKNNISVTVFGR